jgi:hypothetical protein
MAKILIDIDGTLNTAPPDDSLDWCDVETYKKFDLRPGAKEAVNMLLEQGHTVKFVTTAYDGQCSPEQDESVLDFKRRWLSDQLTLPCILLSTKCTLLSTKNAQDRAKLCRSPDDLLIDDDLTNIQEWPGLAVWFGVGVNTWQEFIDRWPCIENRILEHKVLLMKRDQQVDWLKRIAEFYKQAQAILTPKNSDYAKPDEDPYLNFRITDAVLHMLYGTPKGTAHLALLLTKLSRVGNLLTHDPQVKQESMGDTLKDKANYTALLEGYLNEPEREPDEELLRILGYRINSEEE